jgi:CheY-like chemotaxis protein
VVPTSSVEAAGPFWLARISLGGSGQKVNADGDQGPGGDRPGEDETSDRRIETLEEAIRSRDALLSVVAHDLRNPLNVITLSAHALLERSPPGERRPLERILRSASRAQRMVRDLLAVSALETGNLPLDVRPVDTSRLLLSTVESQQDVAAEASVILSSDLSPSLPTVCGDEERLLEVLENLIGNAVKFTPAGGTITVGAGVRGDQVLIWVKDTGCGIAPDQLPHVFDRFFQVRKKERSGVGLGLSICRGIIKAHQGLLWAESTIGVGTTVFVSLPAEEKPPVSTSSKAAASILLVDDRPENLVSLKAILDRPDYRLVTAQSGQEALTYAAREHFAVALIDIAMPEMDGFEVARRLRELDGGIDVPVIFVTAFGNDPEEIHRAYAAGGADYLVKPLDTVVVRRKVAVFVELGRRRAG